MINKKKLQNYQRVYINSLGKRLNEAVSPAGGGGGWTIHGYSHFLDEVEIKDKIKEKALKEAGYQVIQFSDTQVLKDIQIVIAEIDKNIEAYEKQDVGKYSKVHPQPPPAGDTVIAKASSKKDIHSSEE